MIEILPMEDREREKSLLGDLPTPGGEPRALCMKDKSGELGYALVELLGEKLRILKLEAAGYAPAQKPQGEAAFVLDTLLRSAASYGETFGASEIETVLQGPGLQNRRSPRLRPHEPYRPVRIKKGPAP